MTDLDKLLAEFADAYESGRDPDPGTFLARAQAAERGALADRLDAYLDEAPDQTWDPGAYERSPAKVAVDRFFESIEGESGKWPELLPALRNRAEIQRGEVVSRLAAALGFPGETQRVAVYYHQMEHGQLDASRVSDTVLDKLAEIVNTTRERLRAAGEDITYTSESTVYAQFARQASPDPEYLADADASPAAPAAEERARERDELDRLFLGD